MPIPAPSPPVVGGTPKNHSGTQTGYDHVVIHSAVMPCEPGRARQLGEWNRSGATGGSWHYATDPEETIQCSWDRYICWAAPPNPRKIHIEMADWPKPWPEGKTATQLREMRLSWRWVRPNHKKMLDRTARLTAHLLLAEGLPIRFVSAAEMRAGKKGWTTHAEVTKAYHQSSHWDPGFWPRWRFGRMVRNYAVEIEAQYR